VTPAAVGGIRINQPLLGPLPESWQQFKSAAQHVADSFQSVPLAAPSHRYVPAKAGGKSYTSASLGLAP
jgi:hypothetical protein